MIKIVRLDVLVPGAFATFLGTLKIFGILSGIGVFTTIGQTFAISPAPEAFNVFQRARPMDLTAGKLFACIDQKGGITWHRWNHLVRANIPGPHRRIVALLSLFGFVKNPEIGTMITGLSRAELEVLIKKYFCDGGPVAQSAGCPSSLSGVILKYVEPGSGREIANERYECRT